MVLFGFLAAAGGCTYAMPMPPDALRIAPLAETSAGTPFLQPVGILTVPGIATYSAPLASSTGTIVAASITIAQSPVSQSTASPARAGSAVAVWDCQTGALLRVFQGDDATRPDGWVRLEDLSPDGSRVVLRDSKGIQVWSVETGQALRRLDDDRVRSPWPGTFDRTGQRVMVTNYPTHRRTWIDVNTGVETVAGSLNYFDPLARCGDSALEFRGLWNAPVIAGASSGDEVSLEYRGGRGGTVRSGVFSSDCRLIAIAYSAKLQYFLYDRTPAHVRIWDTSTGRLISWYQPPGVEATSSYRDSEWPVAMMGESGHLVIQGDEFTRLIDLRAMREVSRQHFPQGSRSSPLVPTSGGILLSSCKDGISLYRVEIPATASGVPAFLGN